MGFNIKDMENFWETRFQKEGWVWGENPSKTAVHALGVFKKNGVEEVLVPGSGYGRNTKLFSDAGLDVSGYEISATACDMAKKFDLKTRHFCGSVLAVSRMWWKFDLAISYTLLPSRSILRQAQDKSC